MIEKLPIADSQLPIESGEAASLFSIGNRKSRIENAFSMVELLVAMTLLTLIVLALMAVFDSTQRAFRASVTQTDVLEGSRATMDYLVSDLRAVTPSGYYSNSTVNFATLDNSYGAFSYNGATLLYKPLPQSLPGTSFFRSNVLSYIFILGRNNTKWTGVGYVVNATNSQPLYPLYRFYAETNISVPSYTLFQAFSNAVNQSQWTNMSHLLDGVVHLTVRTYDVNGYWMTNLYQFHGGLETTNKNILFMLPLSGEVGCFFYSNAVPAAIELQLGVLEDRTLQRAESLGIASQAPVSVPAQWSYLQNQSGHVHLFRQRVSIPNVDPSAYQ